MWLPSSKLVIGVGGTVVGFVVGVLANNVVEFGSGKRAAIREDYAQVMEAENDLNTLLGRFAAIAAGERGKTPEDVDQLRSELLEIKGTAYNIVLTAPAVGADYDRLVKSMRGLVEAAEALGEDPQLNKPFVSAVADYQVASDAFKKAVSGQQNRFFFLG